MEDWSQHLQNRVTKNTNKKYTCITIHLWPTAAGAKWRNSCIYERQSEWNDSKKQNLCKKAGLSRRWSVMIKNSKIYSAKTVETTLGTTGTQINSNWQHQSDERSNMHLYIYTYEADFFSVPANEPLKAKDNSCIKKTATPQATYWQLGIADNWGKRSHQLHCKWYTNKSALRLSARGDGGCGLQHRDQAAAARRQKEVKIMKGTKKDTLSIGSWQCRRHNVGNFQGSNDTQSMLQRGRGNSEQQTTIEWLKINKKRH